MVYSLYTLGLYTIFYCATYLFDVGTFIQGIQVVYNVSRPRGDRVVELFARCSKCRIPTFDPVEAEVRDDEFKRILISYHSDSMLSIKPNN